MLGMLDRGNVVGLPAVEVFLAEVAAGIVRGGNGRAVVEAGFGELLGGWRCVGPDERRVGRFARSVGCAPAREGL